MSKLLMGAALALSLANPVLGQLPQCSQPPLLQGSPEADGTRPDSGRLTVVSLNLHGNPSWAEIGPAIQAEPKFAQAEILLLQEFAQDGSDFLGNASRALGFYYVFAANQECGPGCGQGLAILSRYPLETPQVLPLPQNDLGFNNRCRIALSASVETPVGKLKLFNLHLDTRINARKRVRQVGPVLEAARDTDGPVLVAGDFNTADFLWIGGVAPIPFLQWQKRAIRKVMKEHGFYTPFTNTGTTFKRFPLKLDWVFLKGLKASDHGLVNTDFTDHKALWTAFDAGSPARQSQE